MAQKKEEVFTQHGLARLESLGHPALASFRRRAAAMLLDFFVVTMLVVLVGLPSAFYNRAHNPSGHLVVHFEPFHSLWGILSIVAYFGLSTYMGHGQSPGKWFLRIRVVSLIHDRLTLWQCIERALGYGASALEGGFGFLQYFLHPNHQTVHDRIAETIVIAAPRQKRGTA